jgi:electron transfer flavoprotein alpha subunit
MKALIIAEHNNQTLKSATFHTVTAARELNGEIDILIIGSQCQAVAEQAARLPSVKTVFVADDAMYEHQLAENCSTLIAEKAAGYDYILAGATTFGKNLLPRVAALLDVSMVGDVTKIISQDTFIRPIYAGNVMATVQSLDKIKILTIRTTAFAEAASEQQAHATIQALNTVIKNETARFESQSLTESKRPELTSARVVISGGRGLKSAENFHMLESIADRLGAAVGASRAAVDAGFAPNDYQVGQTGKVVAPDLYIAVGISGAIQHLAGMKDSKVIVAINNDPDAPIFQIADYGLVGDLFKILPELQSELDKTLSEKKVAT